MPDEDIIQLGRKFIQIQNFISIIHMLLMMMLDVHYYICVFKRVI